MNPDDVEAAFKAFSSSLARNRGYIIQSQTRVFEEPGQLESAIRADSIDLCIIDTWGYLKSNIGAQLRPYFVSSGPHGPGRTYLLITRRDSGLNTLLALQGKTLVQCAAANASLGPCWLTALVATNHAQFPDTFFGAIQTVVKPSAAVLPVFFKKKDACLVDSDAFEVMAELNPQLGRELQVVERSEPLVNTVVCLRRSVWSSDSYKADIIKALSELQLEPAGQQILTLFKTGVLVPFTESQLATVRQLQGGCAATSSLPTTSSLDAFVSLPP
ncbi:MAG TPA: PhnD/SsuA/transferrin family substrate-binding protein [Verrucomicrobiae bacterium]|nr:PhnD/SsuA/transferrin family substrate-binding protein [Verrucomicrobiae bacterium]